MLLRKLVEAGRASLNVASVIVLDANVLIAFLDESDVHHDEDVRRFLERRMSRTGLLTRFRNVR